MSVHIQDMSVVHDKTTSIDVQITKDRGCIIQMTKNINKKNY